MTLPQENSGRHLPVDQPLHSQAPNSQTPEFSARTSQVAAPQAATPPASRPPVFDEHPVVDECPVFDERPVSDEWMMAVQLLRPQGRRGELLADPAAPFELFIPGRQFATGTAAAAPVKPLKLVELESAWQPTGRNAGRLVLKLKGTDSITAAEAIAGRYLFVRVSELPALEEGTYRVRDLTGCTLFDGDVPVGTVLDLQFAVAPDGRTRLDDAPDLLVVLPLASAERTSPERMTSRPAINPLAVPQTAPQATPQAAPQTDLEADLEAETVLVPFVRAWLLEVDLPARRLRMSLPPGLFNDVDPDEDADEKPDEDRNPDEAEDGGRRSGPGQRRRLS